jgi:hypothetical protein
MISLAIVSQSSLFSASTYDENGRLWSVTTGRRAGSSTSEQRRPIVR